MKRNTWKRREREIAGAFGADRTPLSGGSSRHTRADALHDALFIEAKGREKHAAVSLYDQTAQLAQAEGKTPVVALWQPRRPGFLLVVDPADVARVSREMVEL